MTLHIQIITPEKELLSEDIDEVIVPTSSGELTILPHHVPLLVQIMPGELTIKKSGKSEHLAIVGGFLEVHPASGGTPTTATILADYAIHGKDISEAEAKLAKERAEKAMKEKKSDVDFAMAEAEFQRAILELKVAHRQKAVH